MEYDQLIRQRYSVRKFKTQPIEDSKVSTILEAARLAPTAINKQPVRILVIQETDNLNKLAVCTPFTFNAPMAMVVLCQRDEAWIRPYDRYNSGIMDSSIVSSHIMLAVHNLGLGTTWVGHFDPALLRRIFNLPEQTEPVVIFPIGYPAADSKPASMHEKRRALNEIVLYERF